jgi:hypothetical protein
MLYNVTGPIPNGTDEDRAPEHAAILAAETNIKTAFGAASECGLDLRQRLVIGGRTIRKLKL